MKKLPVSSVDLIRHETKWDVFRERTVAQTFK